MKIDRKLLSVEERGDAYRRKGIRRLLHGVLPDGGYARLRGMRLDFNESRWGRRWHLLRASILAHASRVGILSGLFYTFCSREFDREHGAVLAARARHIRDLYAGRGNLYMLRRNVHRIEKGLIMKPARPIFALTMIDETVRAYANVLNSHRCGAIADDVSLHWSRQVLNVYFERSADHPVVMRARAAFDAANAGYAAGQDAIQRVPFARAGDAIMPTLDQFESLALHRRSVRWFADKPVPREAIDKAIEIAGLSPSACNRQPFRFNVYDTPEAVAKVGAVPNGTPGWLHQIPCFIVIVGRLDAFRFERDRHVPYIDGCLAAMSLLYALEVQGISSCCVNFPDLADTERRMADVVGLPSWERVVMCIAVGYPDLAEKVPYSQKVPLNSLRCYNQLSE